MSDHEIRVTRFGAPAAQVLVAAAMAELAARYGSPDATPLEAVQFDPPEGSFLVAFIDGEPVACGGWRTLAHFTEDGGTADGGITDRVAEIKRMYAVPEVRGTGIAAELLTALEESARSRGMRRVILETGERQPEAIKLYTRQGYTRIANYGHYRDEPDCVSFGRDL